MTPALFFLAGVVVTIIVGIVTRAFECPECEARKKEALDNLMMSFDQEIAEAMHSTKEWIPTGKPELVPYEWMEDIPVVGQFGTKVTE